MLLNELIRKITDILSVFFYEKYCNDRCKLKAFSATTATDDKNKNHLDGKYYFYRF